MFMSLNLFNLRILKCQLWWIDISFNSHNLPFTLCNPILLKVLELQYLHFILSILLHHIQWVYCVKTRIYILISTQECLKLHMFCSSHAKLQMLREM